MSSAIQQIAAQLVRLERNVHALSTTPALAYSSIEDGGSIDSNADDGGTMAQFGGQFDGSYMAASLVGPTPPTPSDPIVTAAIGGLTVRWDGEFTDALYAPMDFTRVEVHVSTDPAFVPDTATTLVATIESPRGALPFIARAPGVYYVAFVARSQSGKAGPKSATSGAATVTLIGDDALTSLVKPQGVFASVSNFALTARNPVTVADVIKTTTITVPAGMTSAVVSVISRVFAINPNGTGGPAGTGLDYFFAQTGIAGFLDAALPVVVTGSQSSDTATSPFTQVLTGLTPGDTFTITIGACSDYLNWSAFTNNLATVSGNILWFR